MEKQRILHIVTYMGRGGLETMIMNYYRKINREKIQFDFLVHRDFKADYDDEIESLGGKIFHISRLNPFSPKYYAELDHFFKTHPEYQIVHCHLDCMAGIPLLVAKKNNVPIRIAHAHSSNQTHDSKYYLKLFFKSFISNYSNVRFACAEAAGKWMFGGSNFKVLNNAIDTKRYLFSEEKMKMMREALKIPENAFVVGHVGRFDPPKNHGFIIDVFEEISKMDSDAYLLLVGDGDGRKKIEQLVREKNLGNKVVFTGVRDDVPDVLQAMDVFLFPSIYEGLPVSLVEAQAAGIPCFISDKVPIECRKTDLVEQIELEKSGKYWADRVLSKRSVEKVDTYKQICAAEFDIVENAKWLERFYLNVLNKRSDKKKLIDNPHINYRDTPFLTVFTPAYNRAHTLGRTYESLIKQKCKDFVWMIIDDGSTDNTKELVDDWIEKDNGFEIRYIYKSNGGMHTAHNVAYQNIDTILNVCIDSDDCLAESAVEIIKAKWEEIKATNYAGMIGLDADFDGKIIGGQFGKNCFETTLTGYYANGGSGDKKLVYRTDIIRKYPEYPVFEGEKYVALAYKYRLIDQSYKLAVINKVLCNVEYQADGSSNTMMKQYLKNPNGFAFWRKVCMTYPSSFKRLIIDSIHYVSSSMIARNSKYVIESPRKLMTLLVSPIGFVLTVYIYIKGK